MYSTASEGKCGDKNKTVEDLLCWYLMFSIALLKRASVIYLGLSFSKFSHEEQIFIPALLELLSIAPSRETLGYISMALKKNIKLKCHKPSKFKSQRSIQMVY